MPKQHPQDNQLEEAVKDIAVLVRQFVRQQIHAEELDGGIKKVIASLLATQAKASQEELIEKIEKLKKQNKEAAPANKEEEIDERAYEAALRDVLSSLQDPTN